MNVNPEELLGQDEEDLSAKHALRTGAHDALADIVKYGTMAALIAIGSAVVLDKKTRDRLKKRWL